MTLLSIVGDDTSRIVPVLYLYRTMIKKHILLCDDDVDNFNRAKNLQRGMEHFSSKNQLSWDVEVMTIDEDSQKNIQSVALSIVEKCDELWLNVTDGYPIMTLLLANIVRDNGGKVISYDHFDNDLHIMEADGSMKTIVMPTSMDLDSYLTLLDYTYTQMSTNNQVENRKYHILKLYEDEASYIKVKDALVKKMHNKGHRFDFAEHAHTLQTLKALDIVDEHNHLIRRRQKVLQGDILEEYLYWLCLELNPDDIMVGVKVDFEGSQKTHPFPKLLNEFDVLLIHNNRIGVIECKLSNALRGLDVVYKYDAIIDYFGKASKAIIANISQSDKEPYLDMCASSNFSHSTLRRASMSNIAVYHDKEVNVAKFQSLVGSFFHIGGEDEDR